MSLSAFSSLAGELSPLTFASSQAARVSEVYCRNDEDDHQERKRKRVQSGGIHPSPLARVLGRSNRCEFAR